ncbi:MAG: translation initiation factor IF-2 [Actinobacteria bacterium]|nr:translation initiation factor IF-2 [Actinomycetota bacterium]
MTNTELLDLCKAEGVAAKTPQSTLADAFVPLLERKAKAQGLVRDVQPEETKATKGPKKTAKSDADGETDDGASKSTAKKAPAKTAAKTGAVSEAETTSPASVPVVPVAEVSTPVVEKAPVESAPSVKSNRVISGRDATKEVPRPSAPAPRPDTSRPSVAPAASGASVTSPARPATPPAPSRPTSPPGRPVPPPPPGRAMPVSGRPVPPPPSGPRTAPPPGSRPSGAGYGGPRTGAPPRPGGFGGPRPGGPRPGGAPGGFGGPRPGGPRPGGAPGGPGGPGGRPGGGARPDGGRRAPRSGGRRRRRGEEELQPSMQSYSATGAPVPEGTIVVERGVSAQEFAPRLNRTAADVVLFLMKNGEMVTATMTLTDEQMELFALEIGAEVLLVEPGQQEELELQALFDDSDDVDEEAQVARPPVITVMGHVDHGKTTLLDRIRDANVVSGEAGGITQHIGAYQVDTSGRKVTFIDTPGHAAFTQMRARGAQVTDIVVLMVAADDGVMPQTVEAISHARAAGVPIVVAINKVDKENADVQRVLSQLAERELVPESWGGDTICVEMSAQQNLGVDDLIEQLALVAEIEELTANPTGRAKGVVLEANLDTGRGPVATILVDKGTLKVGDPVVAGGAWGRVRAMIGDKGRQIKEAGPSTPVQVLGLSSVPQAGDEFRVAPDEKTARTVGEAREQRLRAKTQRGDARVQRGVKLEDVFSQIQAGEVATLNLVLKADVQGSLEAVTESLRRLERDEVKLAFVHRAVGGVTENDITLAAATNASIIGFNVRPDRKARDLAEAEHVEIRTYEIIYKLLEDIEGAMVGMLAPEYEEVVTGEAEVREVFRVPKIGAVAGCYVRSGQITRGTKVRFLREGVIIWKGAISSLRRFKDDVREVREGFECGIGLSDFQDLKQGDLIETFEEKLVVRT